MKTLAALVERGVAMTTRRLRSWARLERSAALTGSSDAERWESIVQAAHRSR